MYIYICNCIYAKLNCLKWDCLCLKMDLTFISYNG